MTDELEDRMSALRELYSPTEGDRERVKVSLSLAAGLGGAASPETGQSAGGTSGAGSTTGAAPVSAWKTLVLKGLLAVGTSSLLAGGLVLNQSSSPRLEEKISTVAPASSSPSPTRERNLPIKPPLSTSTGVKEQESGAAVPPIAPHLMTKKRRSSGSLPLPKQSKKTLPRDSLGREAQLLERASRALRQGKKSAAEQALDEHGTRFDQGKLAPEREGLRILSQCKSNPLDAAHRSEAKKFLRRWPLSPLAKHLRNTCALSKGASRAK